MDTIPLCQCPESVRRVKKNLRKKYLGIYWIWSSQYMIPMRHRLRYTDLAVASSILYLLYILKECALSNRWAWSPVKFDFVSERNLQRMLCHLLLRISLHLIFLLHSKHHHIPEIDVAQSAIDVCYVLFICTIWYWLLPFSLIFSHFFSGCTRCRSTCIWRLKKKVWDWTINITMLLVSTDVSFSSEEKWIFLEEFLF